jgi:hypothetical protein
MSEFAIVFWSASRLDRLLQNQQFEVCGMAFERDGSKGRAIDIAKRVPWCNQGCSESDNSHSCDVVRWPSPVKMCQP